MKATYYRSQQISESSLIVLLAIALTAIAVIEHWPQRASQWQYACMMDASQRAANAFQAIREHRKSSGYRVLLEQDPTGSGMIGPSMSLVTTLPGHLDAKQTSVNPNFSAVVVRLLLDAGVQSGDRVAVGCTGSFPALNIAAISALESLGLKPTIVSSLTSSQFGANHPSLMWPDMERVLVEEGIVAHRSSQLSRGGLHDMAVGMTKNTQVFLDQVIQRSGLPVIDSKNMGEAIDLRMQVFDQAAQESRYTCYINVGGGAASVGGTKGNNLLGSGLILPGNKRDYVESIDSVTARFLSRGTPVVNLVNVLSLAKRYGLAIAPEQVPAVGEGTVYRSGRYRRTLALFGVGCVLLATFLIVRPPAWIVRLSERIPGRSDVRMKPQHMV